MTDPKARSLGRLIRAQRELQQVSVRKMASMAGISNPYLSQIERGLRAPSDRVLESIAASLQTSADALLEGAGITRGDDVESDVAASINADPRLSSAQRRALLEIYEAFTSDPAAGDA